MARGEVKVWAVIPAAGRGQRFAEARPAGTVPTRKQLARLGTRSMLATVIDTLEAGGVTGILAVVSGDVLDAIQQERPAGPGRAYLINDRPASAMIESIQMGFAETKHRVADIPAAVPAGSGSTTPAVGCLVCPGDLPGLAIETVARCLTAFAETSDALILATYRGRPGHPLILPMSIVDEVLTWPATARLNTLRQREADRLVLVETDDPGTVHDVDTPRDLDALQQPFPDSTRRG